jgi:beta-phosphoglucomutase-like phosphatase (HAD superfamily)
MTAADSPEGTMQQIVQRSAHVLLDFDGPVCSIFAGLPAATVAEMYRTTLSRVPVNLPAEVQELGDPLEVFRQVADLGPDVAETAQAILTKLETRAARSAQPTPGSADLVATAQATGRTVTIVSNNSSAAIAAYLGDHKLTPYVTAIVGRDDADPGLMKPSPYRVRMAISQLDADPGRAFLVGDSATDVPAGRLAGVAVIGFANKPGKAEQLVQAGADAVTARLADISLALRAQVTKLSLLSATR